MTDSNEVQALEKISSEVDESQLKIVLSIQCIKAQGFLVNKLQKQSEQQKQICNYISNGNSKLQTEIKLAEQEFQSLLVALDTINAANIELRKELLLAKERTSATADRVNNGIKKYEELWQTTKKRYESIPFIQKYTQIINNKVILKDNINKLADEKQKLLNEINKKRLELLSLDRKNIVELAKYMVRERPAKLLNINNKQTEVRNLIKEIQQETYAGETTNVITIDLTVDKRPSNFEIPTEIKEDSWFNVSRSVDSEAVTIPRLHLRSIDLDFFSHKLNKIKQIDLQQISIKNVDYEPLDKQSKKIEPDVMVKDVYVSTYFQTKNEETVDLKSNYSKKKLINILEDVTLDKSEALEIFSKVDRSTLRNVVNIGENVQTKNLSQENNKKSEERWPEVGKVDLTNTQTSNVLIPPAQFLDLTQDDFIQSSENNLDMEKKHAKNSQEKKVTFGDTKLGTHSNETDFNKSAEENANGLDVSCTSDDSFKKIQEVVFKKHNLDLSPKFTYSKNNVTSMKSENADTSKFFDSKRYDERKTTAMEIDDNPANEVQSGRQEQNNTDKEDLTVIEIDKDSQKEASVGGFLFAHGPHGIPDSLDVSVSTLGYEESDFPPCFDSNLLLSPKADDQMPTTSQNVQVLSQEVPNFLSGLKKTGLSFFGNPSEDKCATSTQNQNSNFTFCFGGDGKKSRGGLFSMFR